MNREKIIAFFNEETDKRLAARILDMADIALRTSQPQDSDFVDPHGREVAMSVLAQLPEIRGFSFGGYTKAERHKIYVTPGLYLGRPEPHIVALQVTGNFKFQQITHRDCLGAILSLGIKREAIGDIVMQPDGGCQVLASVEVADFIVSNLIKIHQVGVKTQVIDLDQIVSGEEKVKEIRTTAASLRLDVVAAAGFGMSRSQMADEIKAEKIKVNWKATKSASYSVKPGDVLSMRGRGRVEFIELNGQTKKGRYSIVLKRYY